MSKLLEWFLPPTPKIMSLQSQNYIWDCVKYGIRIGLIIVATLLVIQIKNHLVIAWAWVNY